MNRLAEAKAIPLDLAVRGFTHLLLWAPRRAALAAAMSIATAYGFFDPYHSKIALANLRIAFPEISERERKRLAMDSYRNLARVVVEVARLPLLSPDNIHRLVRYDPVLGLENYLAAKSSHRSVLYLTGHFNCWELLPYAHALYGHPLSFLVRPLDNPRIEEWLNRRRRGSGNRTIPKKNSTRHILSTLSRGGDVGILIDQNVMANDGSFVPFFGKLACTTTGLARLALKTGSPVVPGRIQWQPEQGIYHIQFLPALNLPETGDFEQDVLAGTKLFNEVIEKMIRMDPAAWLWGHRRWQTRPPEDPESPYENI
jgi:Kdo2-lipid IVA lauroyltransferase/acyltransferase